MEQEIKIYALVNPLTKQIFYVGATSTEIEVRLSGHLNQARNEIGNKKRNSVIKDIIKNGDRPEIVLLNTCSKERVDYYESFYYKLFLSIGYDMLQNDNSFTYSVQHKNKTFIGKLESVKLPKEYVVKLREYKKATGIPIAVFICQSIDEKLERQIK